MKKEEKRAQKRASRRMKKGERQKLKKGVKTRHSERLLTPFKSDGKSERRAKEERNRTGRSGESDIAFTPTGYSERAMEKAGVLRPATSRKPSLCLLLPSPGTRMNDGIEVPTDFFASLDDPPRSDPTVRDRKSVV